MDVNEKFKDMMKIAAGSPRRLAGTSMSMVFRERLAEFCKNNRLDLSQGLDLAVFVLLTEAGENFDGVKLETADRFNASKKMTTKQCRVITCMTPYDASLPECPDCHTQQ